MHTIVVSKHTVMDTIVVLFLLVPFTNDEMKGIRKNLSSVVSLSY